jgi:hypothetical protein
VSTILELELEIAKFPRTGTAGQLPHMYLRGVHDGMAFAVTPVWAGRSDSSLRACHDYKIMMWTKPERGGWASLVSMEATFPRELPLRLALLKVAPIAANLCVHPKAAGRSVGNCLTEYICPDCKVSFEVDSSG